MTIMAWWRERLRYCHDRLFLSSSRDAREQKYCSRCCINILDIHTRNRVLLQVTIVMSWKTTWMGLGISAVFLQKINETTVTTSVLWDGFRTCTTITGPPPTDTKGEQQRNSTSQLYTQCKKKSTQLSIYSVKAALVPYPYFSRFAWKTSAMRLPVACE